MKRFVRAVENMNKSDDIDRDYSPLACSKGHSIGSRCEGISAGYNASCYEKNARLDHDFYVLYTIYDLRYESKG